MSDTHFNTYKHYNIFNILYQKTMGALYKYVSIGIGL